MKTKTDNTYVARPSWGSIIILCGLLAIPTVIGGLVSFKIGRLEPFFLGSFSVLILAFSMLKGYRVMVSDTECSVWIWRYRMVRIPWNVIEKTVAVFAYDPTLMPGFPPQRLIVHYQVPQRKPKTTTVTLKLLKLEDAQVVLAHFLDKGKLTTME